MLVFSLALGMLSWLQLCIHGRSPEYVSLCIAWTPSSSANSWALPGTPRRACAHGGERDLLLGPRLQTTKMGSPASTACGPTSFGPSYSVMQIPAYPVSHSFSRVPMAGRHWFYSEWECHCSLLRPKWKLHLNLYCTDTCMQLSSGLGVESLLMLSLKVRMIFFLFSPFFKWH